MGNKCQLGMHLWLCLLKTFIDLMYLLVLLCYRWTMMKQEARRKRPTRKMELLNNINNISAELPYLFSCTIQRNIFIDYFLKSRFFSSSILEAHFIDNIQEKTLEEGFHLFPPPVFPEGELQS